MLTVAEAIKVRRSIRRFTSQEIPDSMVEQMLEAARLSPSSSNSQPWRFLIVRNTNTKKQLRQICLDQKFIEEAPVIFVCFGDLDSYSVNSRMRRRQEMIKTGVSATLSGKFTDPDFIAYMDSLSQPSEAELIPGLFANTFIAIEHIVLMATAMGLGTCWVGGFTDVLEFNRLFNLPDNLIAVAVLVVGYPAGNLPPPRPRLSLDEIVIHANAEKIDNKEDKYTF